MSTRHTVVSFHAHPDDEALLTAGTLAKAVAEGHRVVLVVATAGERGLVAAGDPGVSLGDRRLAELHSSAAAIGCARVVVLGYGDSGLDGSAPEGFTHADVTDAAGRLAAILRAENATVLTTYDRFGGYGHPDHVQVHRVGALAGALADTPVVLEATLDRALLQRGAAIVRRLSWLVPGLAAPDLTTAYTARAELTHRIDVTRHLDAKRAALAAHATQASADSGTRLIALLLRLPGPLFRLALGTEWFREPHRGTAGRLYEDIFATLTTGPAQQTSLTQRRNALSNGPAVPEPD